MINRNTPEVMVYFRSAAMHLEASAELLKVCPKKTWSKLAHEVIYLSGYVVECVLKAAILSATPPRKQAEMVLRFRIDLKHNLDRLKKVLVEGGCVMPAQQTYQFRQVLTEWNSEMRYEPISRAFEDADNVHRSCVGFYSWAERS